MLSTLAIFIGLSGQANVEAAAPPPAATQPAEEIPSAFKDLHDQIGAKAFEHLVHDADLFWMQLRKLVANFDKRKIEFKPDRPPKVVKQRFVAFALAHAKATGSEGTSTHAGMFELCKWRLERHRKMLDGELQKSRRGLGAMKTVLANLKALEVDNHAHYPVNVSYLRITKDGQLENARESYANVAELKAARKRIENMVPALVHFAEKRVNGLNRDDRALEVINTGWDALAAASQPQGS
jgi:hypothetical protein